MAFKMISSKRQNVKADGLSTDHGLAGLTDTSDLATLENVLPFLEDFIDWYYGEVLEASVSRIFTYFQSIAISFTQEIFSWLDGPRDEEARRKYPIIYNIYNHSPKKYQPFQIAQQSDIF